MGFIIRFMVNLFDLGIFWYYFHCFKQMKKVPKGTFYCISRNNGCSMGSSKRTGKSIPESYHFVIYSSADYIFLRVKDVVKDCEYCYFCGNRHFV